MSLHWKTPMTDYLIPHPYLDTETLHIWGRAEGPDNKRKPLYGLTVRIKCWGKREGLNDECRDNSKQTPFSAGVEIKNEQWFMF